MLESVMIAPFWQDIQGYSKLTTIRIFPKNLFAFGIDPFRFIEVLRGVGSVHFYLLHDSLSAGNTNPFPAG